MEENLYAIAEYVPPRQHKFKEGKAYPIRELDVSRRCPSFLVQDENGDWLFSNQFKTAHLDDHSWTIVADLTPEQRRMAGLPTEDATIAELRERIEALEARVPVEERAEWPQAGSKYWYILIDGTVAFSFFSEHPYHTQHRDFLGVYKTREEAEHMACEVKKHVAWYRNEFLEP